MIQLDIHPMSRRTIIIPCNCAILSLISIVVNEFFDGFFPSGSTGAGGIGSRERPTSSFDLLARQADAGDQVGQAADGGEDQLGPTRAGAGGSREARAARAARTARGGHGVE